MKNKLNFKIYIKVLSLFCALCILVGSNMVNAQNDNTTEKQYVIITENIDKTTDMISDNNIEDVCENKKSPDIVVANLTESQAKRIDNKDFIVCVEEDITLTADTTENPKATEGKNTNWNLQMINNTYSKSNEKIKVGVLDSGVNLTGEYNLIDSVSFVSNDNNYFLYPDMTGHGTSVAGIISSDNGITNNADICSIKVLDDNNKSNISTVVQGIYWALENDVKILNISLGTNNYSAILENAINEAYRSGILIIASAGNDTTMKYPAAFKNVLAVGSIDNHGKIISKNTDKYEELIFAPGENILSTGDFGFNSICSGTSMAAPHVTGAAVELWSKDTSKTNQEIKNIIINSAKTVLNNKVLDLKYAIDHFDEIDTSSCNIINENNNSLKVFDDSDVKALWYSSDHAAMVNGFSGNVLKFVKFMSKVPDKPEFYLSKTVGNNLLGLKDLKKGYLVLTDGTKYLASDEKLNFKTRDILHSGGNYVASLKFLYTVARNLKYNNYSSIKYKKNQIKQAMLDAWDGTSNLYNSNLKTCKPTLYDSEFNRLYAIPNSLWDSSDYYNTKKGFEKLRITRRVSASYQRQLLEQFVYLACSTNFDDSNGDSIVNDLSFCQKSSYKVLGLAIHLSGDIYAHKSIVKDTVSFSDSGTENSRNSGTIYKTCDNKPDFNEERFWSGPSGIKTILTKNENNKRALITTAQLDLWESPGVKTKTEYPDSLKFYSTRYNEGASILISNIIKSYNGNFVVGSSSTNNFSIKVFLKSDYPLKLANLKIYAKEARVFPISSSNINVINSIDSIETMSEIDNYGSENYYEIDNTFYWRSVSGNSCSDNYSPT